MAKKMLKNIKRFSRDEEREFELEFLPGMDEWVVQEIRLVIGKKVRLLSSTVDGRIGISYTGDYGKLSRLRTIVAAHRLIEFKIPRPRALLGHANWTKLLAVISEIRRDSPDGSFKTFKVSAAGSRSSTFTRISNELGKSLQLESTNRKPDLLISVRPKRGGSTAWQVLVRQTPRPLSARTWRVCDYPGALNSTIAYLMTGLTDPTPNQRFLNIACGSGTLLVERLCRGPVGLALGVDSNALAIECARRNITASGYMDIAQLMHLDASKINLPSASIDAVVVDMPYGMLSGISGNLRSLYAAIVEQANRLVVPKGKLVVITTRKRLFLDIMYSYRNIWILDREIPLKLPTKKGDITPTVWVLCRK